MGLVLDSTATVAAERAGFTARQLLQSVRHQLQDDDLAISVVTVLELAHGVARADTETRRAARQRFLDEITAVVP